MREDRRLNACYAQAMLAWTGGVSGNGALDSHDKGAEQQTGRVLGIGAFDPRLPL